MKIPVMKVRNRYDDTFKKQAVMLWRNSGQAAHITASELGIDSKRLYLWQKQFFPKNSGKGKEEFLGKNSPDPSESTHAFLSRQLVALRLENERLRQQRDILKKTLGIISEPLNNDTKEFIL